MIRGIVVKTKYFCETKHDIDAIMDYSKQKGYMFEYVESNETIYHFYNIRSIDEIVDSAVLEGLFEFYENKGTCYRLTKKGIKVFPH